MPGTVLIIDADEEFSARLKSTLEAHGAEVQTTGDGRAGLDMARLNIPKAIVVCVELPRMSGYSICAKLKKDPVLKTVTLVITSAEATQETFEHHKKLKNRAEEYLRKPFEPQMLADVLRPYIGLDASEPDDIAISEDLAIDPGPVPLLDDDDDDAFDDERFHFDEVPQVDRSVAVEPAPSVGSGTASVGVNQSGALTDGYEEDEAMTTIGVVPAPGSEVLFKEIEQLRNELEAEREAHAQTVRERDDALASDRATGGSMQAVSSPPASGRELLAIKKELHDRDKQLLQLRDEVQQKERELLEQRDREMGYEGQIVQMQESLELVDRERGEIEAQLKALREQVDSAERNQQELNGQVAQLKSDVEARERTISANEDEITSLRSTNQALNGEVTRLNNEVTATAAESATLREQLHTAQSQSDELSASLEETNQKADSVRSALEATQASLVETEEQAARAFERIRRDAETRTKVRQALDIALRLLTEPEEEENGVEEGVSATEARP